MIVIGIVGSPAGGKSTVAKNLQELGATWINADLLAREVLEQDQNQQSLIDYFGSDIADKSGRVDRVKLARLVFGDDDSSQTGLRYLEGLIHPQTRQLIQQRLRDVQRDFSTVAASSGLFAPVVVLDVPLLFEVGWDRCCDQIWCIDASRELRLKWAALRGWDDAELSRRESNQLSIEQKKHLSTHVINNCRSMEELRATLRGLWSSIVESSRAVVDDGHCDP